MNTYNSTNAGFPWPIISSKLSGFNSRTFDANVRPTDSAAARKVPNLMSSKIRRQKRWWYEKEARWK